MWLLWQGFWINYSGDRAHTFSRLAILFHHSVQNKLSACTYFFFTTPVAKEPFQMAHNREFLSTREQQN